MAQPPSLEQFLKPGRLGPWIGGRLVEPADRAAYECIDPGTGQAFASFLAASPAEVDLAVDRARTTFRDGPWRRAEPAERAKSLRELGALVTRHRKVLAQLECMDTGKTMSQALTDITHFSLTLGYYADLAESTPVRKPLESDVADAYVHHAPAGISAVIIPWNFPIILLGWNIAPALAAGNSVVVKPAEQAALSTLYIAQLAMEAGVPPGVFNVVPGDGTRAGAALAANPRLARMSFTGSPEVGASVAAACAHNLVPVKLELGGKGAAIVLDDADVSATVKALVKAITMNAGQVCCTATRWVVHRSILEPFLEQAAARLKAVRVGYWDNLKTRMGPLISRPQQQRVLGYIERSLADGAEAILWDGPLDDSPGFFARPALLTGPADNVAAREEIFGPAAYVLPFETDEEAVELVNSSDYGLANSVWSGSRKRAARLGELLVAGTVWINVHNFLVPGIPYAGVGRSGFGAGTLGAASLSEQMRQTVISGPKQR